MDSSLLPIQTRFSFSLHLHLIFIYTVESILEAWEAKKCFFFPNKEQIQNMRSLDSSIWRDELSLREKQDKINQVSRGFFFSGQLFFPREIC